MSSNLTNELKESIEKFTHFRQDLYDCFDARQDTVMDLLDALASNNSVRSTVELSLNPLFRRDYSALYKAIEEVFSRDEANPELDNSRPKKQVEQLLEAMATPPQAGRLGHSLAARATLSAIGTGCDSDATALCANTRRQNLHLPTQHH